MFGFLMFLGGWKWVNLELHALHVKSSSRHINSSSQMALHKWFPIFAFYFDKILENVKKSYNNENNNTL